MGTESKEKRAQMPTKARKGFYQSDELVMLWMMISRPIIAAACLQ